MAEKKKKAAAAKAKAAPRKRKKDPVGDADTDAVGATAREFNKGTVDVVNTAGEKVSDLVLHPEVFRTPIKTHLLYEAVKQYRAGGRRGTHMTKNRALVSGSGRKP